MEMLLPTFTDLPEHCLLEILAYCDVRTWAAMSHVSMYFKQFICVHFFRKMSNFNLLSNTDGIIDDLITVSRVVTTTNPRNFTVVIQRNLLVSKESAVISVALNSLTTEVIVEAHFLRFLNGLDNIRKLIESIHIRSTIYDAHNNDGIDMGNFSSWSNLKKLNISGYDKRIKHMLQFPINEWKIEVISFDNMYITGDLINDTLQVGNHLKNIKFQNCKLEKLVSTDLITIAENVRIGGGHFPLGLTFINVKVKGDAFLEVIELYLHYNEIFPK